MIKCLCRLSLLLLSNNMVIIQSITWTGLGIAGALVYLDVITVQPYNEPKDFFPVTLAKLYFEGPNSKINGSYLGQFHKDYRNPNVIDLFWPDKVFAVSVTYVITNVSYFFLSILFCINRNSKTPNERRRFLDIAFGWSCITFVICAIDVMFMYFLLRDFLQIKDYLNNSSNSENISDLVFIPLILALVPGRIIILFVWNFVIACLFFFDALCCKKVLRESFQTLRTFQSYSVLWEWLIFLRCRIKTVRLTEQEVKQEQKVIGPPKPPQVLPPVKLINKSYGSSHDIKKDRDSVEVKAMEAVTSFSDHYEKSQALQLSLGDWNYAPSESSFESVKWNPKLHVKEWDATNKAYEPEEAGSVVLEQNQHSGQKQIKVVKPPIGKPVEEEEEENLKDECNEKAGSSRRIDSLRRTG